MILENIKFDDSSLLSKKVITAKDVLNALPESIREYVADIKVVIDNGQTFWRILLNNEIVAGYLYAMHSGVLVYDGYACRRPFGRIFFAHRVRFFRKSFEKDGNKHVVYSVYCCRPHHMFLLYEVDEVHVEDPDYGPGVVTYLRYCQRFKN